MVGYYPKTRKAYDPYIFVLETDYEDFIIDLFSELPTTSTFFKVLGRLVLYAYIKRESVRDDDIQPISDVTVLHIPLLIRSLSRKGIVRNVNYQEKGLSGM